MQSLEASKNYKNSFICAAKIFKDEGLFTFWSGALPRLVRLTLSGGIVFTMLVLPNVRSQIYLPELEADLHRNRYEKTMEALDILDPERRCI